MYLAGLEDMVDPRQKWTKSEPKVNQKWTKSEPKVNQKWTKSDTIEKEEHPATPYHKISHYTKKNCVLFVLLFCRNFSQVKGVKIHNPIL